MGHCFHDQLQGETFYFAFGKHWIFLLLKALTLGILITILTIFPLFLNTDFIGIGGEPALQQALLLVDFVLITLLIHHFFLWQFSYLATFAIVTNYRIIVVTKSAFFHSEKEVLDLSQIRDIQTRKKGLFCNIFNCGDINLILSTQDKDATVVRSVCNPTEIQAKCNAIRHRLVHNPSGADASTDTSLPFQRMKTI